MIERYTDYRRFLVDAIAELGRTRRDLAQQVGLSESMVSQVLSGQRRLNPAQAESLAQYLGLDARDRHYLAALVDLENDSPRARRLAWSTIQAHQRRRALEQPNEEASTALSDWYVGAVMELATCEGFRPDARWIAATLTPSITEEQAAEALRMLLTRGLLEPDEERGLRPAQPELATGATADPGAQSLASAALHAQAAQLSLDSLAKSRPSERHISTMVFALPEERWAELVSRLRELESELMHLITAEGTERPNRVYVLGVQLFPVSLFTDTEYDPTELDDD